MAVLWVAVAKRGKNQSNPPIPVSGGMHGSSINANKGGFMEKEKAQSSPKNTGKKVKEPTVVVYYQIFWSSSEQCVRLYDAAYHFIYHARINCGTIQELAALVTVLERKNTLVTFDSDTLELRLRAGSKGSGVKPKPAH